MVFYITGILSHDHDTIHAGKGCVEVHDFHMDASVFLTGHGIKARTYAHAEIKHFTMRSFPCSDDAPYWEICDFRTGMGSCNYFQLI